MKALASIILDIKGRPWTFKLFTDKSFDKMHNPNDEGNAAMTLASKYEVHFAKSEWDLVDIRHEVGHCFKTMSNTGSSELDAEQTEELMCEIIGHHCTEIILVSDKVAECFLNYHKE
jgi:hypothetical protein